MSQISACPLSSVNFVHDADMIYNFDVMKLTFFIYDLCFLFLFKELISCSWITKIPLYFLLSYYPSWLLIQLGPLFVQGTNWKPNFCFYLHRDILSSTASPEQFVIFWFVYGVNLTISEPLHIWSLHSERLVCLSPLQ